MKLSSWIKFGWYRVQIEFLILRSFFRRRSFPKRRFGWAGETIFAAYYAGVKRSPRGAWQEITRAASRDAQPIFLRSITGLAGVYLRRHFWKSRAIIRRQIWAAAVFSKFGLCWSLACDFSPEREALWRAAFSEFDVLIGRLVYAPLRRILSVCGCVSYCCIYN